MLNRLKNLPESFNSIELRMRVLFSLVAITLCFLLFDLFWYSDAEQEIKNINSKITASQSQTDELLEMQNSFNSSIVKKRNDPRIKSIQKIEQQINEIRNALKEKTVNLVPPELMANVITEIIRSSRSLKLQSLIKQDTVELSDINQPIENKKEQDDQTIKLYRHSIEVVLLGDYVATFEFLKNLEEMEKKVAFDRLDYSVDKYPNAEVTLIVSTLSLEKGWIGG
ncbi:MAG: hypothetical protein KUG78_09010 [Kangiellaceae bacterium]|nr:hypothetical protein [Kangiellaceae bacterium]